MSVPFHQDASDVSVTIELSPRSNYTGGLFIRGPSPGREDVKLQLEQVWYSLPAKPRHHLSFEPSHVTYVVCLRCSNRVVPFIILGRLSIGCRSTVAQGGAWLYFSSIAAPHSAGTTAPKNAREMQRI
eukprot:SAG11_NODE_2399_length_3403_cov_2.455508_2_plen_128_part_00